MSSTAPGPAAAAAGHPAVLTLGVEEEYLLLDPGTGRNAPVVEPVRAGLDDRVRPHSRLEFRHSMLEMVTGVHTGLGDLRRELLELRRAAAAAATAAGARLVAVAATPVGEPDLTVTDNPRFRQIARHYGPIAYDPAVCGCHVHVGVGDRELAVQVCNHLRVWLPVVQALTVNSPLFAGADTGHASWRSMQLERWPSLGPWPGFTSLADYDATVAAMVATGAMLDSTMVLWYVRPSAAYPTVEVRVGDVCPTAADTVLAAGLIRGLVGAAVDDIAAGVPAPALREGVVRAAHWNAARTGVEGTLLDLRQGRARPAWDLVDDLVATVTPALSRHGDLDVVADELERLRKEGTGATRQRRLLDQTGDVGAVLAELAELTTVG